ncbi:MAG: pteridine reductase [Thiotrichales bacterium]
MSGDATVTARRVALITGAARRIGAEIARTLHAAGLNVIIHYRRSAAEAHALAEALNQLRPNSARLLPGDLTEVATLPALIERAIGCWGQLDVLINNASSFYPTPIGTITAAQFDDLIGSNLRAPLFLAQAAAAELKRTGGCICNIVDIHAERPLKDYPVYSAAKGGLVVLTRALARELGPEVRVNAVAPGAIMWPEEPHHAAQHQEIIRRTVLKREGHPSDIARTIQFLALDAPYITGQIIAVDGGRTLSN